jgi:hypothetical protein
MDHDFSMRCRTFYPFHDTEAGPETAKLGPSHQRTAKAVRIMIKPARRSDMFDIPDDFEHSHIWRFGWIKAQAGLVKLEVRGSVKADVALTLAVAAYNLIRIPELLTPTTP